MAGVFHRPLLSSIAASRACHSVWRLSAESHHVLPRSPVFVSQWACRSLTTSAIRCKERNQPQRSQERPSQQTGSILQEIVESKSGRKTQLTPAERVVEAGKDAGYSMFALLGLGMVGVAAFFLIKNEFGSGQPSAIFRRSLRTVRKDKQVCELVGTPFKAFGYSSAARQGWRHHVQGVDYLLGANDDLHRQVKYFIKGKQRKAVVTVDMKETKKNSGKFDYYTISVAVPGLHPVLVLDNRYSDISLASYQSSSFDMPPLEDKK